MKKNSILLVSIILLILGTVTLGMSETTIIQKEFYFEGTIGPAGGPIEPPPPIAACAHLTGNIHEKEGNTYILPLTGTITIGDEDSIILAKPFKVSEPMNCIVNEPEFPPGCIDHHCAVPLEVNIGGDKYMGFLGWNKTYCDDCMVYEFAYFNFIGVKDGEMISCEMFYPPMPPLPPMSME